MKHTPTLIAFVLLSLICLSVNAQDKSWEGNGFVVTWKLSTDQLEMTIETETTGWVSVGFEPTRIMKDANIIIASVLPDGSVIAEDHYGTGTFSHKKDTDLGGTKNVTVISGSESEGKTRITFSIPLNSGDSKDVILTPGKKTKIILASSKADSFTKKHNKKAKTEIEL